MIVMDSKELWEGLPRKLLLTESADGRQYVSKQVRVFISGA